MWWDGGVGVIVGLCALSEMEWSLIKIEDGYLLFIRWSGGCGVLVFDLRIYLCLVMGVN